MTFRLLLASAAIAALAAGAAQAATHGGGVYAEPAQPIAYSKLDAYLKATPRQRAHGAWTLSADTASAQTGTPANTAATVPQTSMTPSQSAPPAAAYPAPATDSTGAAPPTPMISQPAAPDMTTPPPAAPDTGAPAPQTPPAPQ